MALALPAVFAGDTPVCPDVATPPAPVCIATTHGLAYAATQADAQMAADAIDTAAGQFQNAFGRALPPGLLVLSATFDGTATQQFARDRGLGFSKVWLSPADKRAQIEMVMRRANPDLDASRVTQTLDQVEAQHLDILRHELGHTLYHAAFWPEAEPVDGRYGTPAPDWLDEAAAVHMEGDILRAQRAQIFFEGWKTASPAIRPLAEFLTMAHPILAQRQSLMQADGAQTASGIQVMRASGDAGLATAMFYPQAMLFADFLEDTSSRPQVLGAISEAIAAGADFEAWLADTGAAYGLPADVGALQTAWDAWCTARADNAG